MKNITAILAISLGLGIVSLITAASQSQAAQAQQFSEFASTPLPTSQQQNEQHRSTPHTSGGGSGSGGSQRGASPTATSSGGGGGGGQHHGSSPQTTTNSEFGSYPLPSSGKGIVSQQQQQQHGASPSSGSNTQSQQHHGSGQGQSGKAAQLTEAQRGELNNNINKMMEKQRSIDNGIMDALKENAKMFQFPQSHQNMAGHGSVSPQSVAYTSMRGASPST